ncbi:MAG TPA: protease complex subunit PrcB family protein [Rubrobacteraceae bacterium]|nr:protease complex subunit PrcB family protein [Rubrobacteraceae bacterium]
MLRAGLVTLLLLLAGCSAGDGSEEPRDLRVEQISSDAPGQGPRQPRAVVAPSAAALSGEVGANVPDSGSGTYLAAYWGEKPTGGYSMSVRSARLEGSRVIVRLALKEPPRDAILTQALTYPYAVAVIRELDPGGKDFSFMDENGRELGWPVSRV